MLRRALARLFPTLAHRLPTLALLVAALVGPASAIADELRQPQKLTVAVSDELLGQLAPDGKRLYFVSNRNAVSEIFTQDLSAPASRILFDDGADATWPRVSPDGKRLSYVSYADDATGRVCVRTLDAKLARRCLDARGALEAEWIDAGELLVLSRPSVGGDLVLSRVRVDGVTLKAQPILARNLNSPSVSPPLAGKRWLAYVPLARAASRIGPAFAAQAARALALRPLDDKNAAESTIQLPLPGGTTQPAFSPDGQWLYFTQFLNDTDQNGVLDGDDHGVIFRVRLDGGDPVAALRRADPEQLTSAQWNCQYPAPSASRLILTCARGGSLDVYSLPLDGMVPSAWTVARLREERAASRDDWERLMLLHHILRAETDPRVRAIVLCDVLRWHLVLGEYEAALFHARALAATGVPSLAELGALVEPLVAERRALRAFDRGELGFAYLEEARKRVADVQALAPHDAGAVAMRHLVLSELFDDLGDKQAALDELDRATIAHDTPFLVVLQKAQRAEALLRQLDRHDALLHELAPLVDHPSLSEREKLTLGGIYARALLRPLSRTAGHAAAERERATLDPQSARAFALQLWPCLDDVGEKTLPAGRACINAIYDAHPSLPRRRMLVAEVVRRAEDTNADDLEYELARRWVHDVPAGSAERPHAERLFRHVLQDYAYAAYAAHRYAQAADEFATVTQSVTSLEAHIGLIESEIAMGKRDLEQIYATRYQKDAPVTHFMRAYLDLRALPELDGAAFDRAWQRAFAEVQATEQVLPQKCEVQALHGAILHLKYLRSDDRAFAEEANTHYLLALDLAHDNQRYRAMVLEELALLHAAVGNDRIAIAHFVERGTLPFSDERVELGHQLGLARSLFHVGKEAEAAKVAMAAVTLSNDASLTRFRPLALDRAALYTLAAGDGAAAAKLYDAAVGTSLALSPRNDVVRGLARAAAALQAGRPAETLADLDRVTQLLQRPGAEHVLDWPEGNQADVEATYTLLRLGLRGQAERALGRLDDAQRTLGQRHDLLLARAARRSYDDDLLALSTAEAQLADLARARNDQPAAAKLASQSLAHADELAKKTATPLSDAQLSALRFAAELHCIAGVPASAFGFDVRARVRDAYDQLAASSDSARRHQRILFGVYLALLTLDGAR